MPNPNVRGTFLWHELLTSDPAAAKAFYTRVVGWKPEGWADNPDYQMFVGAAGPVAGFMRLPDEAKAMGAPPHWHTYIGTPDVDASTQQAESLGGTVMRQPEDIPGVGRFSIVRDPGGAVFSLFTPGSDGPGRDQQTLGEFSWHELISSDLDASWDFYSEMFGWEKMGAMDSPEIGTYQMFGHRGLMLGGMYQIPQGGPMPPNWLPYALLPDTKRAVTTVKGLGGQVLHGPMEVPGGDWVAVCMDPQGVVFATHSKAAAATAAKPAASKPAKAAAKPKASPKRKAAPTKKATPKRKAAPKKKAASKKKAARKAPRRAARKAAPKKKAPKRAARKAPKRKAAKRPAKMKGRAKKKK